MHISIQLKKGINECTFSRCDVYQEDTKELIFGIQLGPKEIYITDLLTLFSRSLEGAKKSRKITSEEELNCTLSIVYETYQGD